MNQQRTSTRVRRPRRFCRGHAQQDDVHRYYDPATGQFVSVDPAVSVTGQPYSYAEDDPANSIDPSGLACTGAEGFLNHLPLGGSACNVVRGSRNTVGSALESASSALGTIGAGGSAAVVAGIFLLPEDSVFEGGAVALVGTANDFAAGLELIACQLNPSMAECTTRNQVLDASTLAAGPLFGMIPADIRRWAELAGDVQDILNWLETHKPPALWLDAACGPTSGILM